MVTMLAGAQKLKSVSPQWQLLSPQMSAKAPMKAASLEGTTVWGYYLNDDIFADENIAIAGAREAGEFRVGYFVPCSGVLKGAKIQGVHLPVADPSCVSSCEVLVMKTDAKTVLASQTVDVGSLQQGFNDVVLAEPVAIDEELFVAYNLVTTGTSDFATHPILYDYSNKTENSFIVFGTGNYVGQYVDNSATLGALCMQLYVSGMNFAGYNIECSDFGGYTQYGAESKSTVAFVSNSENDINNVDYTVSVAGGEAKEYHATVSVPAGFNKKGSFPITFTSPTDAEKYTVEVNVTKVNGESAQVSATPAVGSFSSVSRLVNRKVVMEEMTGTGCPWCTRGIAGMEKARNTFGDSFVGVAYHIYNNNDPMYPTTYPYLGWSGAPSCFLDRSGVEIDPYFGSSEDILVDIAEALKVPALVDMDVVASFDEDKTNVSISAEVEALAGGEYEMVYLLVADGLTGASFVQYNNYYQYSAENSGLPAGDPLLDFCNGGKYGSNVCKPIFNDVAIAASYDGSFASLGEKFSLATGEKQTSAYSLAMPVKSTLVNAIKNADYDVYAVVVALNADGTVANTQRVKVKDFDGNSGIGSAVATDSAAEVARYTIDGRRITTATPGINVVRMSDGTCRKVMVK